LYDFSEYKNNGDFSYVDKYLDKEFLNNPGREEYLASEQFRHNISYEDAYYLKYILRHQNQNDTISKPGSIEYKLKEVNRIFNGEVRAFISYNLMMRLPRNFTSIENFNRFKNQIKPYFPSLSEPYKEKIETYLTKQQEIITINEDAVAAKEAEKALNYIGNPAPSFSLKSNTDQTYSLADFKGKVVLLNLWSSWSDLCRDENKAFNKLYQKYKDNKRIAFISIAVYDDYNEWQRVLKEDQLSGVQLFDKDRVVLKAYIEEHVPKFILIARQGNVVNFMAPKPSKGDDLEKLINKEL
jgi:peroxiredoxin